MSRIECREERCKGCLLCTLVCPAEILVQSERFNAQGYKVAEVSPELREECTGCGACAQICPDFAITVWRTKGKRKEGVDRG
jgi:2-oxoglutarate ferredoxin oxidoreductase subunit delta